MSRIMHLADLHLGSRLTGLHNHGAAMGLDPDEIPYQAFDALMERALSGEYDGVIIAGDVFDRGHDEERALLAFEGALHRLHDAGIPVAMIAGNHDAELSLLSRVRLAPTTSWLGADEPGTVVWHDLGIALHGQSIRDRDESRDLAAGYPRPFAGLANLGVLHTSLGGEWSNRACAPTTVETLDASGYDYWALGHVHERRTVSWHPLAVYPGSVHGRRPEESGGHGFVELLLDGDRVVSATPVDTSPVRFEWLRLTGSTDAEQAVRSRFDELGELPADAVVLWTITGDHDDDTLALARERARAHQNYLVL